MAALSLGWVKQQPAVTSFLVGARSPEELGWNLPVADQTLPLEIGRVAKIGDFTTGIVALKASEEFGLTVETQQELQKADVAEFARALGAQDAGPVASTYRFLKPEFVLDVKVEPVQAQLEAVVRNHLHISPEQLTLTADVAFTIKRAGVFALRVAVPGDFLPAASPFRASSLLTSFFFTAFFVGPSTMTSWRPSIFGYCSTVP